MTAICITLANQLICIILVFLAMRYVGVVTDDANQTSLNLWVTSWRVFPGISLLCSTTDTWMEPQYDYVSELNTAMCLTSL